ncbi:MAG: 30S ribosomal protein S13 [Candidatus Nomurabacteria bacterium]|jgi:small subunit ribosomal protein S13|nr:30S ribosomal protein S13 [Candidatus Nomurabacteria bacterium]
MARFANIEVPANKQVGVSLTYIYGVGPKVSADILAAAQVNPTTRVKDLTEKEEKAIRDVIDSGKHLVEGDLHRIVVNNIKRLKDIQSYRGIRHKANLPARGQRTRTNGRTKRGRRIAVGGAQPKAASKT